MAAHLEGKPIECSEIPKDEWWQTHNPAWNFTLYRYRQKPEPKKRPWSSPDDVPALCWLRNKGISQAYWMILGVFEEGVHTSGGGDSIIMIFWKDIHGYEWSATRTQWFPCEVQE